MQICWLDYGFNYGNMYQAQYLDANFFFCGQSSLIFCFGLRLTRKTIHLRIAAESQQTRVMPEASALLLVIKVSYFGRYFCIQLIIRIGHQVITTFSRLWRMILLLVSSAHEKLIKIDCISFLPIGRSVSMRI